MNKTFLVIACFAVTLVCLLVFVFMSNWKQYKEVKKYRALVPSPGFLLRDGADISLMEFHNEEESCVHVFGQKFLGEAAFNAARTDIISLQAIGYKINTDYFYIKRPPPSEKEHEELLLKYEKALLSWSNEKQGRPDKRTKPSAPYDRVVTKLAKDLSNKKRT